jgi:two-component system, OmpR family, sensor histidine kinase BaeS
MNRLEQTAVQPQSRCKRSTPYWFTGILTKFNRLSWRLAVAMSSVLIVGVVCFLLVADYHVNQAIVGFVATLEPKLGKSIAEQFDLYAESSSIERGQLRSYLTTLLLLVTGSVIVAILMAKRIARPLDKITRTAAAVAQGQLNARVALTPQEQNSQDEVMQLAVNFNTMAASLEHLEHERRVTNAAIAHELRTPLTVLQTRVEGIRDGVVPMSATEAEQLLSQIRTLTRLVGDLRTLSLAEAEHLDLNLEDIDLLDVVTLSVASFGMRAELKNIALELNFEALTAPVRGDRDRLTQVIMNLLENAIRYTPAGGQIDVDLVVTDLDVCVIVRDNGPGFPSETLPHLFERFYRADPSRSRASGGSGLGLSVVQAIMKLHAGTVQATNAVTGGAQLELRIARQNP